MTFDDNKADTSTNNLVIKPDDLKKKIDTGEDVFILDVRNQQEHDMWSLSYDRYQDSTVIPIDKINSSESLKQIPKDKEIITFCTHGQRSSNAAKTLSELGSKVKTIEGGLDGWSNLYDVAKIDTGSSNTEIWQMRRISKGCMSYMIAYTVDKKATVMDSTCNIDDALKKLINEKGLKIVRIIDTHMHADHLSANTKLAKMYGAELGISSFEKYDIENNDAQLKNYKLRLIKDDEKIEIGNNISLEAIHTPGHTEGSMSFKLEAKEHDAGFSSNNEGNTNRENKIKTFLFTGDTIFVNGVGRPDLHNRVEEYAKNLYNTIQKKLFELPDDTIILPAHYSASFDHQKPVFNTLKSIKQKLSDIINSEDNFIDYITANIPPQSMNYQKIMNINKALTPCDMVKEKDLEAGPNSCAISA